MKGHTDFVIKATAADYYAVLGVAPMANGRQIKEKYYALCRIHHPDVGGDTELMARITEAYAVLRDPTRRKAYDERRKLLCKPCPTCNGEGVTYRNKSFTKREAVTCRSCNGSGLR